MFDRKKYKNFALQQLKGRWVVPVLISLFIVVITNIFSIPDFVRAVNSDGFSIIWNQDYDSFESLMDALNDLSDSSTSTITSIIQIIVDGILTLAAINVYIQMSRSPNPVTFSLFIEGLNEWWKGTLAVLWRFLWVSLWSLLLLIPGIIKAISYSQMLYILGEYKDVSVTKSMRISMIITQGHKADLFVTYLSFLGWMILAAIPAGLGFIFLEPYIKMTMTNVYHALLKEALETGKITPEDLA